MNFPSIDIQGSIISADLLGKIRSEQASYQQGKDFRPEFNNAKLKDEISLAWQEAKGQWTIFQSKLKRLKEGDTGATETRSFWILPLLSNFGYDFQYLKAAEEINGKSFWINNRDNNLGGFPLFIAGCNESLDKRPENKQLRVSPHALVQEYLNYSEHLYGLVTNGKQLRLLRDASRITRLSYVEFNLEKMMEEDLYSDFVILYRVLHASRMPQKQDAGGESIIEKFHQEGLEAGATIRNKLGSAVKETIKSLANGFINHPDNIALREAADEGRLNAGEYYRHQLRIIYRLLFLFVIEERNLVYADSKTPETKRFNQIYFNHYSLLRLRKLAKRIPPPEAHRHYDLWQSLLSTFALFEKKEVGEKMGIMALQGDLFSYHALQCSQYDLHKCRLSNAVLLAILKSLGYFENENNVLIAVNYGGLDVEEFGSVYEGLLELKLKIEPVAGSGQYSCTFEGSSERSSSGSHYTPEELVQPLIKHSLEYLIKDKLKEKEPVAALLGLKVCDVACGSGHILLSAARRIALEIARVQTGEEQPNPLAIRKAMKQVIRQCIYGVDKNPLAVELCKVALWLEAHNPGEPLNFLDHHIKCGDAIVGLAHKEELENGIATEAFTALTEEEKENTIEVTKRDGRKKMETIAKVWREKNALEKREKDQLLIDFNEALTEEINAALDKFRIFENLPERTSDDVQLRAKEYEKYITDPHRTRLEQLANAQVAQFFIPKIIVNKEYLLTEATYRKYQREVKKHLGPLQGLALSKSDTIAKEKNFFHWFIEFPSVFEQGGFDCVLGNPPFLGGLRISSNFGDRYLNYLYNNYQPAGGTCDLVAYFFRRDFDLLKIGGFQSLISTNTIAQGDTREGALDVICKDIGSINFAVKSMKWPGQAHLEISLLTLNKNAVVGKKYLNGIEVDYINTLLDSGENIGNPKGLISNQLKCFTGTTVLGKGFVLDKEEASSIVDKAPNHIDVILPYLIGEDINSNPDQVPSRYVINFSDWSEDKAKNYALAFEIVRSRVFPERQKVNREARKKYWWRFGDRAVNLYDQILHRKFAVAICRVTKYLSFSLVPKNYVYDVGTNVVLLDKIADYSILHSCIHEAWARKYGSSLETRLRYTNEDCFESYPMLLSLTKEQEQRLDKLGQQHHDHRKHLMLQVQLGLTKTYNAFHAKEIQPGIITADLQSLDKKAIEKQYGKEVWNLYNHLQKQNGICTIEEAIAGIIKLRELHVQMDNTVLDAYGWSDMQLQHDFYEVDYLPENDRTRYTIHPDARKEILKRLLALNHQIHEEEVAKGLWDKKKPKKKYVTEEGEVTGVEEPESVYRQPKLFEEPNLFNKKGKEE